MNLKFLFFLIITTGTWLNSTSQDSLAANVAGKKFPGKYYTEKDKVHWIIPGTLLGLGIYGALDDGFINRFAVYEERQESFPLFKHNYDNYAQYASIAAVYAMDLSGVRARHDIINRSVILLKGELLMTAIVFPLKSWTHVLRPDSSSYNSFPSGHTAQAFLAADFFQHEFGYKSVWYTIAGYTVATSVGVFRVLNNRHWISDVLAGAGIGILCGEVAYATHRYKWNRKKQMVFLPGLSRQGMGIYMALRF